MVNQRLSRLYETYFGEEVTRIVPCGVVDDEAYSLNRPRLVVLLKEVNSRQSGWSLPEFVRRQATYASEGKSYRWRTWKTVGLWSYGIHNGFPPFSEIARDRSAVATGLRSIGITNLRKAPGGASANMRVVTEAALESRELLRRELEIMSPDVVICGNTFQPIVKALGLTSRTLLRHSGTWHRYSVCQLNGHPIVLLDMCHPQASIRRKETYSLLQDMAEELGKLGLWLWRDVREVT